MRSKNRSSLGSLDPPSDWVPYATKIAAHLLKQGAQDLGDPQSYLQQAARNGQTDMVRILIEACPEDKRAAYLDNIDITLTPAALAQRNGYEQTFDLILGYLTPDQCFALALHEFRQHATSVKKLVTTQTKNTEYTGEIYEPKTEAFQAWLQQSDQDPKAAQRAFECFQLIIATPYSKNQALQRVVDAIQRILNFSKRVLLKANSPSQSQSIKTKKHGLKKLKPSYSAIMKKTNSQFLSKTSTLQSHTRVVR